MGVNISSVFASYSSLRKSKALDFSRGNWEKVLLFFMILGGLYLTLDGRALAVLLDVEELEELKRRLKLRADAQKVCLFLISHKLTTRISRDKALTTV